MAVLAIRQPAIFENLNFFVRFSRGGALGNIMDIPQIPSIPRNSPAQNALSGEFFLDRQLATKVLNINDMRATTDNFSLF
jgi:hypothetical protein